MFGEIKNAITRGMRDRIVIGIDLTDDFSQLSFAMVGEQPQTMSAGADEARLCIPTVLSKRYGENAWSYGAEALALEAAGDASLVDCLLSRALSGRIVEVEGAEYDPTDLLSLFLRKCLSRLLSVAPLEKVSAIVISVATPDERTIRVLSDVVRILRLKKERVYFQSHAESAYYYIMHQRAQLRAQEVLICDLQASGMECYLYRENIATKPHVMLLTQKHFGQFHAESMPRDTQARLDAQRKARDQEFRTILYSLIDGHRVSAVYLLGDGFDGEWCDESLRYICGMARAFRGNNLFSQGACYSAQDKVSPGELIDQGIVFLGKDKLKANLGLMAVREGEEAYLSLLDAGRNWYDSVKECDLIADSISRIELVVTPVDGKERTTRTLYLDGLPARGHMATRLHLELKMLSENKAYLKVSDLGFGEFYASTGLSWEQEFVV